MGVLCPRWYKDISFPYWIKEYFEGRAKKILGHLLVDIMAFVRWKSPPILAHLPRFLSGRFTLFILR